MKHYHRVPLDMEENLKYRKRVLEACRKDPKVRAAMMQACKEDILFWLGTFAWCFEPRPRYRDGKLLPKKVPFIPWPHQVPAIQQIMDNLGREDIGIEKSRAEGASWIGILIACHQWLFHPMTAIGVVSKDEDSADTPDDMNSLLPKIDWELKVLPPWMAGKLGRDYKRDRGNHVIRNLQNGSTITAYAATGNVASGGRAFFFLMDELAKFPRGPDQEAMASTQHVTDCRLVVSTPLGSDGAYYELMHTPSSMVKVTLSWEQNPTKNQGLYKFENGKPVAIDPVNNPLPPDYDPPSPKVLTLFSQLRQNGFVLEDKVRSPWYDHECNRAGANPQNIAQELDRDYGGSSFRVFSSQFVKACEKSVTQPIHEGLLDFSTENLKGWKFGESVNGPMKLWVPLDHNQRPPESRYIFGADISMGGGGAFTSNSVLFGLDAITGEQVFEYTTRTSPPQAFADICIAVCGWFHNAFFGWEHNGPGAAFTRRVIHREYGNVYRRTSTSQWSKKESKEIGWQTTETNKPVLFGDFHQIVRDGEITIRSRELLQESGNYVFKDGKIHHALVSHATDDAKGVSHGDRIIGAAVAVQCYRSRPPIKNTSVDVVQDIPEGTFGARHMEYLRSIKQKVHDWID